MRARELSNLFVHSVNNPSLAINSITIFKEKKMKKQFIIIMAGVLMLVGSGQVMAAMVYTIIDLGTVGGYDSWAYSISNNNQIVGWAKNASESDRACLFDATGAGNNITLSETLSYAWSINNKGQIVGSFGLWENGTISPLELGAFSINDSGQIVGLAKNGSDYYHATLFDPTGGGVNIDLGTLGGNRSHAQFINNKNQIVGWAHISGSLYTHACLFDPTGGGANTDLGALDGGTSYAYSINENGLIVGVADNSFGINRAVLFDPTGQGNNIDLGTLGGNYSEARSINDKGQILGWAENSLGYAHACLFDPTGQGNNIDLNTLIGPSFGWTLEYANSINNNSWIVGYGLNADGVHHAFLLTPEPATLLLLGFGALFLRRKR